MNFVAQLEEYLKQVGTESTKKHPGVREASQRALEKLKNLQVKYVSAVREAQSKNNNAAHPDTSMFRSSDLLHPFLLAANYPNASANLLDVSFKAMKLLMDANAICPGDGINMIRVWIIQAQVVASHSRSRESSSLRRETSSSAQSVAEDDSGTATSAEEENTTTAASTTASSTSSWLGSLISSSTAAATETVKNTAQSVAAKTSVSSSHGQTGSGNMNPKMLEKIGLDILSCLIKLLELRDLPVTTDQWIQSVTLCCLLNGPFKQHVIQQAAKSTLPQVLTLLMQSDEKLFVKTWEDLATCMAGSPSTLSKKNALHGAFSACRLGDLDAPRPPSSVQSVELMTMLIRDRPAIFQHSAGHILGLLVENLRKPQPGKGDNPLEFIRVLQFVIAILQTQEEDMVAECRELVQRLIQPIRVTTDSIRNHGEFEDGFFYKEGPPADEVSYDVLSSLMPASLWRASLCLETLKLMVLDSSTKLYWVHHDILPMLVESISDFCTIGASCESSMILLVAACRKSRNLFHEAEALASSRATIDWWNSGVDQDAVYVIGAALWSGLETILKILEPSIDTEIRKQAFGSSLAVLQHYLKRFPASGTVVKRTLEGYFKLASLAIKTDPLLREALFTSLCKLSLPQWGNSDPSALLQDNHIAALICLLNIIHRHYNNMGAEWRIVLQTFEELSQLPIDSSLLSDSAYVGALSVSAVYSRFASFTTCLSDGALADFVAGLGSVEPSAQSMDSRTTRLSSPSSRESMSGKPDKSGSIGGKLMSMGVRAIYGGGDDEKQSPEEDVPVTARTQNCYYQDYQHELTQRLQSSNYSFRLDYLPFSVALLCDVAMANRFRYESIGTHIGDQVCNIAAKSDVARPFAMDTLAMLCLSQVSEDEETPYPHIGVGRLVHDDPRQNEYLAVENSLSGAGTTTIHEQQVLFEPVCQRIRTTGDSSLAVLLLETLNSVLENAGHHLKGSAWVVIIDAIASLTDPERFMEDWSECAQLAFSSLKLIVEDFIDQANDEVILSSMVKACSAFGRSGHDVNISLTSIGLIWKIAENSSSKKTVDLSLSDLSALCSDPRTEVRNCAVNTLFSCVVGRGSGFDANDWKNLFNDYIIGTYRTILDGADKKVDSPLALKGKSKSRYILSVHHSRDSTGKQWLSTRAIFLGGLGRLLRTFFGKLLETTDEGSDSDDEKTRAPWFEDAWNVALGFAYNASIVQGGRESVELKNAGVDFIILCCQLASSAGIDAALNPARVSTDMEVVNGALRTIQSPEKSSLSKNSPRKTHSAITEMWRENLFLDAFDVLESLREYIEGFEIPIDGNEMQVMAKLAADLNSLYNCCKDNEFRENGAAISENWRPEQSQRLPRDKSESLISRFSRVLVSLVNGTSNGAGSKFPSQAQRGAIEVVKSMMKNGSFEAIMAMTLLSGPAFFFEKEKGVASGIDIAAYEAAASVAEAVSNPSFNDEGMALILNAAFHRFLQQQDGSSSAIPLSFRMLLPLTARGLASASSLASSPTHENQVYLYSDFLDELWRNVSDGISRIVSMALGGSGGKLDLSCAAELTKLVETVCDYIPEAYQQDFGGVMSSAAAKCLSIAEEYEFDDGDASISSIDTAAVAEGLAGDALILYTGCFKVVCALSPGHAAIQAVGERLFQAAVDAVKSKMTKTDKGAGSLSIADAQRQQVVLNAALLTCQALQKMEPEKLTPFSVAIFPQLCHLVLDHEHEALREAAAVLLGRVDLKGVLAAKDAALSKADERRRRAEAQVVALSRQLENLQAQHDRLESQIVALSGS